VLRVLKSDQAIDFLVLRHSCGFSLANRGYDLRLIQFKITLGIAIPSTPFTIHASPPDASRGFGVESVLERWAFSTVLSPQNWPTKSIPAWQFFS